MFIKQFFSLHFMPIQNGTFVEITYVGKLEDGTVFDMNDKTQASNYHFKEEEVSGPTIVCIGERDVVEGLDDFLVGKEVGVKGAVSLPPEKAFGKKDPKLFQMIPLSLFKKQDVTPIPGLRVTVEDMTGTVRTVSGGRVIVDFNHPLAGRNVVYEVEIKRIVTDIKEQVKSVLNIYLHDDSPIEINGDTVVVTEPIPPALNVYITELLTKRIPAIKTVQFGETGKQDNIETQA